MGDKHNTMTATNWSSLRLTRLDLLLPSFCDSLLLQQLLRLVTAICLSWSNACCTSHEHAHSLSHHSLVLWIVSLDFKGLAWIVMQSQLLMHWVMIVWSGNVCIYQYNINIIARLSCILLYRLVFLCFTQMIICMWTVFCCLCLAHCVC